MIRARGWALALGVVSMGCMRTMPSTNTTPSELKARTIPMGTPLAVELPITLMASTVKVGQRVSLRLLRPLSDEKGQVVIPVGSQVLALVTGVHAPKDPLEPAVVRLHFQSIAWEGHTARLAAEVVQVPFPPGPGVDRHIREATVGGETLDEAAFRLRLGEGDGSIMLMGSLAGRASLPKGTTLNLRLTEPVPLEP